MTYQDLLRTTIKCIKDTSQQVVVVNVRKIRDYGLETSEYVYDVWIFFLFINSFYTYWLYQRTFILQLTSWYGVLMLDDAFLWLLKSIVVNSLVFFLLNFELQSCFSEKWKLTFRFIWNLSSKIHLMFFLCCSFWDPYFLF